MESIKDRIYMVTLKTVSPNWYQMELEQKTLLRVPKGVEIDERILQDSGYYDDWWEDDNGLPLPSITDETRTRLEFSELKHGTNLMGLEIVEDCGKVIVLEHGMTPTLHEDGCIED